MKRPLGIVFALVCIALGYCGPASAHRLDEYLQAARFSIARDRVDVEIDLTPGVSVAEAVFASIDTDHDRRLSSKEAAQYAQMVFRSIGLSIDGVPVAVKIVSQQFPDFAEMNSGVGMIRLRGTAALPTLPAGHHELFFRNTHEPKISVYLANALVPTDNQIEITGQRREADQHELVIDYRVVPASSWTSALWLIVRTAGPLFYVL